MWIVAYRRLFGIRRMGEPYMFPAGQEQMEMFIRQNKVSLLIRWMFKWEFMPLEAVFAQYRGVNEMVRTVPDSETVN